MPANKYFKRLIRGRMGKTGESYTAARAHLLAHRPTRTARPHPTAPDYATLAGRSDAALKAATGCTWERWVRALDHVNAHTWTRRPSSSSGPSASTPSARSWSAGRRG